jgi:hypothetical protein
MRVVLREVLQKPPHEGQRSMIPLFFDALSMLMGTSYDSSFCASKLGNNPPIRAKISAKSPLKFHPRKISIIYVISIFAE